MKQDYSLPLSIIIPVYNVEKYLERCVQSILTQSYEDYEVILVDDGSTDHSGTLCDELALRDSRIRVFHQKNRGLSCARNIGISHALGKYIWFVDSDDYIARGCLEEIMHQLLEEKVELICFGYIRCSSDTRLSTTPSSPTFSGICDGNDILRNHSANISSSSFVSMRDVWEKYALSYTEDLNFEDLELWPRLLQCVKTATALSSTIIPYHYYLRDGSIMRQASVQKRREQLEHFFRIEELWSQWFHFEHCSHTAYELLMMKQGTNMLHRNILNFVRNSPFPLAMKLQVYGMLWKRGVFSWFYKGKLRHLYPGKLSIRFFWNTIGRSLILFSVFSMIEDLMKRVYKS